jgi:hypothetical protein
MVVARSHSSVAENASSLSLDTSSFHAISDSSFSSTAVLRSLVRALHSALSLDTFSRICSMLFSASIDSVLSSDRVSLSVFRGLRAANDLAENAGQASSSPMSLSNSKSSSFRL